MVQTLRKNLAGSRGVRAPGFCCLCLSPKTSLEGLILLCLVLAFFAPTACAQEDSLETTYLDHRAAEILLQRMTGVREVTTVDYDLGVVVTTLEKDGQVLGIVEIVPLSEYLAEVRKRGIRKALKESARKATSKRQQESEGGLIPAIDIPIELPKPIAGIIGQGGKIDVKGSQGIQFGGSKHFELEQQQTELTRQSPFPELKMKQHLIVNLEGTVGQKVHVFVDHDSERETETKNKIKLRYEGDEDEIVQLIEAGDTQLSLPGTRLIGGPPTHKGLFGLKGKAKVGPLNITAIASKEQGKAEELTISGGAVAETLKIDDIRFLRWRFFWIPANTTIKEGMIKVFVDDGDGANDDGTVYGEAYIDPDVADTTEFHSGRFDVKQVDEEFYTFDYQNNIIELARGLGQNQDVLAVSYVTALDETVGTFKDTYAPDDTVIVQLMKPKIPGPDSRTWSYELKNVYSLGATYVKPPVELRVRKYSYSAEEDPWTEGGKTYLEILGLDESPKDGAVDVDRIRWEEGLLIFPNERPFQSDVLADPDTIYDRTTFTDYSPKYYIEAVAKGTKTTFSLNRINILEGSVQVKLNGRELVQGQDYTVDYDLGMVTLLAPEASRPDAEVTITYQYAPFLSLASKSLLGTRAIYQFSDRAEIGTSWMYRSEATRELRPKLGEESRRILVGEVDGHFNAEPDLFTRLANALPLVSTEAKSSFRLSGEAAISMPNPNTQGEVFIDDMEGTRTSYSIGVTRPSWLFGSVPDGRDTTSFGSPYWYNPRDGIPARYLDPNLPQDRRNDQVTVLVFGNKLSSIEEGTWVSLNRSLSMQGLDFSRSRALELWVKGDTGRIHIDVGTNIPEDAPRRIKDPTLIKGYNGRLDTEDIKTVNGQLDYDEDTGLDGVQGDDDRTVSGDDGNDDYKYDPGSSNYSRVNGTENNDRLDTEDLNGNHVLDSRKDYFEFTFDLSSRNFVVNDGEDGWRLFRLALDDSMNVQRFGNPDWENITAARIWMDGFSHKDSVTIAGLDIVGNKWKNGGVSGLLPDQGGTFEPEERVEINVKNNERDPDYTAPFDPGTDPYGNQRREQSLVINFFDINAMHRGTAYQLISQTQDYSDYKDIRLYVHGDTSNPTFFIKFGGDEKNYYEYREVVGKGWHEFVLPIQEFTDRKLIHKEGQFYFDAGGVGYGFYGKPSFRNIKRMEVGVINQQADRVSGEIWIDEIRLSDPRKDTGTSSRISLVARFADLMGLDIGIDRQDSEFRGLASERGSGATTTTLRASGNTNLDKFFPEKWGMSIPVNVSMNRNVSLPKYQQSSDIILSGEEARKRASHTYRRGGSISLNKTRQSLNKLLRWTIDNVRVGASASQNFSDSETRADSNATYNTSISYSYSPRVNPLSIFGLFGLSYFPSHFSLSSSYNKTWRVGYVKSDTQNVRTNVDDGRIVNGRASVSYDPLKFVSTDYSIDQTRDLNLPGTFFGYDLGSEIRRAQAAGVNYHFPLWTEYLSQSMSYDTRYVEDHDPDIGGLENDYRNVSNSNSTNLSLTLNISKFMSIFSGVAGAKDEDLKALTPKWLLAKFLELSSRINSPNGSYTRSRNSQYSYLKGRPSWQYQFGFRDDVEDVPKEYYVYDQTSVNNTYQVRSGLSVGDLNLSISHKGSDAERGYSGSRTRTKSTTWPDMSVTLRSFEKFVPIKMLMQSSDLRSSFSMTRGESGPLNTPPTTRTKAMNFSPLVSWHTTWKRRINTEVSTDYSVSEKESGTPMTTSTDTRKGVSLKVSTSFSAPTGVILPFLGKRVKFKSNLDLSLSASYSSTHSKLVTEGSDKPPRINADTESFSISPRASYNFSKSVTGGLTMDFRQNRDKQRGRTGRDVNVEFDVLFKF